MSAICAALGDDITPENLLIQDLIDRRAYIRAKLREAHTSGEATHHENHLRLLLAFARGMGIKHELFDVEQEWEQLPIFGKDRAAQMVITFLIDNMIHPKDVTQQHLDQFYDERRKDHYSIPATNQAIAYLKLRIREVPGLAAKFPLARRGFGAARSVQAGVEKHGHALEDGSRSRNSVASRRGCPRNRSDERQHPARAH